VNFATIKAFLDDESGATAMEYALVATLIGMTIIVTFIAVGDSLRNMFGGQSANVMAAQTSKIN
jgi:pilus assembly protein Flp/PilA